MRRLQGARRTPQRRAGQALVEVALGLMIFLLALTLVLDTCWLYYHQAALEHGVARAARLASMNQTDREGLRREFFLAVGPTQITTAEPGRTRLTITTAGADPLFATTRNVLGLPSVRVHAEFDHHPLVGLGGRLGLTLSAERREAVEVWEDHPAITF